MTYRVLVRTGKYGLETVLVEARNNISAMKKAKQLYKDWNNAGIKTGEITVLKAWRE